MALTVFFLPILITILKSGTSTSLLNCFAKRSFPIQQTKILIQIPFSTRSVFCVMKTAQIFIQDFAKRFCSMFISSNQLPGLREAFFVFTLLSKQSSDSQFEGFLQLWFNVGSYTQVRISGDFLSSRKTVWAERCPPKTTAAALDG